MDTSKTLVLKQFSGVPEITPEAHQLKEEALAAAGAIKKVETEEEQLIAVTAMRKLKDLRVGMEATRKSVKAPVLKLGKDIDLLAQNFLAGSLKEERRIEGLVSHFQRVQIRAKMEAAAVAEHREMTGIPPTFEEQMAAELAPAIVEEKPAGLVVRTRLNFQITDPHVFCQAYPQFFEWNEKSEYLKLKRQDVLDELNREDGKGVFHMAHFPEELPINKDSRIARPPGCRIYEETKSHVR